MQKPQSRGDAAIAMNRWLEILRSGAGSPIEVPLGVEDVSKKLRDAHERESLLVTDTVKFAEDQIRSAKSRQISRFSDSLNAQYSNF
jgi:hypothetical protein